MAETIESVVDNIYDDFTNDREIKDLDEKLKRLGCLMRKADVEKKSKDANDGIKKLNTLKKTDIPGQLNDQQKGYLKKIKEFTSKHSAKMWRYKNVYSKKCAKMGIETGGKGVLDTIKDAGKEAMDKMKKKKPAKMREEMPAYLLNAITKEKPAHPVYGKLRY